MSEKNQEQRRQDLFDVREHGRMTEMIIKALCNIEYHLEKLKTIDAEYANAPSSREHARHRMTKLIHQDFSLLELQDQKHYINTFGAFYRLHKSLKEQYESEILDSKPVTCNKL